MHATGLVEITVGDDADVLVTTVQRSSGQGVVATMKAGGISQIQDAADRVGASALELIPPVRLSVPLLKVRPYQSGAVNEAALIVPPPSVTPEGVPAELVLLKTTILPATFSVPPVTFTFP